MKKPNITFHEIGNDPNSWISKATSLINSSEALLALIKQGSNENVIIDYYGTILMLRGMSIECYFKAIYLSKNNALVDKEKLITKFGKNHNLEAMGNELNDPTTLHITTDEKVILRKLGSMIELGRYPIPSKKNKIDSLPNTSDGKNHKSLYWTTLDDDKLFYALLKKIKLFLSLS